MTDAITKDVNATPRVDAVASDGWTGDASCVPYEFAQELEREINRLKKRIASYEAWERSVNEALNSGDGAYRP